MKRHLSGIEEANHDNSPAASLVIHDRKEKAKKDVDQPSVLLNISEEGSQWLSSNKGEFDTYENMKSQRRQIKDSSDNTPK